MACRDDQVVVLPLVASQEALFGLLGPPPIEGANGLGREWNEPPRSRVLGVAEHGAAVDGHEAFVDAQGKPARRRDGEPLTWRVAHHAQAANCLTKQVRRRWKKARSLMQDAHCEISSLRVFSIHRKMATNVHSEYIENQENSVPPVAATLH